MSYQPLNPNGSATSANSSPVVIASDQAAVSVTGTFYQATQPVSAASLPLPTGASTSAKQDTGNTSLASLDTKAPALGQALAAASVPVVMTAAQLTTLTPPAAITGFATAAKQPALGTAGTASADVITVQGIASMTALKVDGSSVTQPVSGTFWQATQPVSLASVPSHAVTVAPGGIASGAVASGAFASGALASGSIAAGAIATGATSIAANEDDASANLDTGVKILAIQKATPADTAGTDGDYAMPQMSAGRLWVTANMDKIAGTATDTNSGNKSAGTQRIVIATDQPNLTTPLNANVAQMNGVTVTMGNGAAGTGVQRVTMANDSTGNIATIGTSVTPGTSAAHLGKAEDAAHASGDTGVAILAVRTDTPATTSSTTGDYDVLHTNATGQLQTAIYPDTVGGLTPSKTISAASTNATSLKGSAGQVYSIQAFNLNASPRYLKLYNKATSPTVGTDTPVKVLMIPGNSTNGAGFVYTPSHGVAFGTGIAFALTTGIADADTGAVAASEIVVNIDYK